jgi:TIR domain-containing protein
MSKIIVSYRRSDSAAITGRIFDRLIDRYGEESVFMDIDRIPFGTDFRHHIQDALRDADLLLAVIGPTWLGKTADGRTRIQDEADPVRVEIETALRQGLTVIPVLVDNAPMPPAADLPASIRDFAYINAAPIDIGRDFRSHMERLTRSIDGIVGTDKAAMEVVLARGYPDAPKASAWSARRLAAVVGSLAVVVGGAIIAINLMSERLPQKQVAQQPQSPRPPQQEAGVPPAATPAPTPPRQPSPPAGGPLTPVTYRVLPNVSGGFQNLRRGPAVKYPIVIPIPAGATGIELGTCRAAEDNTRPWCQATWRGLSGWISSCCIVDEKTGQPPKVD